VRGLPGALRCELLKARRSKVPTLTALGFSLLPVMDGIFMFILKDPGRARAMGLIGAKAQLTAGVADWPTYLGVMAQAVAVGGGALFALVTAWVFGREFADRTAKLTLALPTPRASVVTAKFVVVAAWSLLLSAWVLGLALAIGWLVDIPGWSGEVVLAGAANVAAAAGLTIALLTLTAFLACAGGGYLAPLGFAILMVFLAQILAAMGWGAWFPWSVPPLFAGLAGPRGELLGLQSYALVAATSVAGLLATFAWWTFADQTS
jgi:ABC-2 type transport system permease protein